MALTSSTMMESMLVENGKLVVSVKQHHSSVMITTCGCLRCGTYLKGRFGESK